MCKRGGVAYCVPQAPSTCVPVLKTRGHVFPMVEEGVVIPSFVYIVTPQAPSTCVPQAVSPCVPQAVTPCVPQAASACVPTLCAWIQGVFLFPMGRGRWHNIHAGGGGDYMESVCLPSPHPVFALALAVSSGRRKQEVIISPSVLPIEQKAVLH